MKNEMINMSAAEALVNFYSRVEDIELTVKDGKLRGDYFMEDGDEIISIGVEFVECNGWTIQPKHFGFDGMTTEETDKMIAYLERAIENLDIHIAKTESGELDYCELHVKDVQGNTLDVRFNPIRDEAGKAEFVAGLKKALLAKCSAIVDAPKFRINAINKTFGGCGHLLIACEKVIWNF